MPTTIRRMDGWIPGHGPGTDPRDYNIRQLLALPPVKPLPPKLPDIYWTVLNPIVLNQGSTPECFSGKAKVLMEDFSYRPISEVRIGDYVFTHMGRKGKVTQIFKRKWQGVTYKIKPWGCSDVIEATPEHPFLTLRGWIKAKDLLTTDHLAIPTIRRQFLLKPVYEREADPDFLWLLGIYLAEGYKHHENTMEFGLHIKETAIAKRIREIAAKYGIKSNEYTRDNSRGVSITDKHLSFLIKDLCGEYCHKKKLSPRLMLLPPKLQMEIFRGWEDGDGYDVNRKGTSHVIVSTSEDLIWQMYHILLRNGKRGSIQKRKERDDRKSVWVLQYADTHSRTGYFKDRYFYTKIKKIEKVPAYMGENVYNLEVEGDNSYIVHSLAVHNCVAYASSGMKTDEEYHEWNRIYKFNSGLLYKLCKQQDGAPNDPGTWPKVACDIMLKQGMALACKKTMDPKWGINGYYGVTVQNSDDEIKAIMYQYGTMLFASDWYDNWMDMFEVFPAPGNQNGGHCYRCVGWTPIGWIIVNSWGKLLWGNFTGFGSGIAVMPYGIYRQYVLPAGDSWKIIDKV